MRWKKIVLSIIVSLLIILWIYTGLNKLLDYEEFRFQLGRSPFVQPIAGLVAATLPTFELLVAALLIFSRTRLIGLYASFFLMLLFTGYIWAMLNHSYYVPCSCGGVLALLSWEDHLKFNIAYTILTFAGILLHVNISKVIKKGAPVKARPVPGV